MEPKSHCDAPPKLLTISTFKREKIFYCLPEVLNALENKSG